MPYVIKHKSDDVCYVQYLRNKRHRGKFLFKLLSLLMAFLGLIIFGLGMDRIASYFGSLTLIFLCFIFFALWKGYWMIKAGADTSDDLSEFVIEINRTRGMIVVRSNQPTRIKPTTYSFGTFKGFGFHKTQFTYKSKALFEAELFFKMEPAAGMRRNIPVRNPRYIVAPENAQDIVDEVDRWLGLIKTEKLDEPMREEQEEIFRDFRDME